MGNGARSVMGSLPVFCFAIFGALTPRLARGWHVGSGWHGVSRSQWRWFVLGNSAVPTLAIRSLYSACYLWWLLVASVLESYLYAATGGWVAPCVFLASLGVVAAAAG